MSLADDILDILSDDLVHSVREKRKAMEGRDSAISQAKRRQEVIAELAKGSRGRTGHIERVSTKMVIREGVIFRRCAFLCQQGCHCRCDSSTACRSQLRHHSQGRHLKRYTLRWIEQVRRRKMKGVEFP